MIWAVAALSLTLFFALVLALRLYVELLITRDLYSRSRKALDLATRWARLERKRAARRPTKTS